MTFGWPGLTELDAYRISEIPRRLDAGDTGAPRDQPKVTTRLSAVRYVLAQHNYF